MTIRATSTSDSVPIELALNDRDGPVTGLTVTLQIRDSDNAAALSYFDFDAGELDFKTAGWVQQTQAVAEVGNGLYRWAAGFDPSAATLPAGSKHLAAEFTVTGTKSATILVPIIWTDLQDAGALTTETVGSAMEKIRKVLTNRALVNGTDTGVTIYEDDGTTPAFTFTISADRRDRTTP